MVFRKKMALILVFYGFLLQAKPVIEEIKNNTKIGFMIVVHTDQSECTYSGKNIIIEANESMREGILLDDGSPAVVLRPVYIIDENSGEKKMLVDSKHSFDKNLIGEAYRSWLVTEKFKKRFKDSTDWLAHWVGGDIEIYPRVDYQTGYAHDTSFIQIKNESKKDFDMLIYSVGIFSKLVLAIEIELDVRNGIIPKMRIIEGEGAICRNFIVEVL